MKTLNEILSKVDEQFYITVLDESLKVIASGTSNGLQNYGNLTVKIAEYDYDKSTVKVVTNYKKAA